MTDLPPAGYVPLGWTPTELLFNVGLILGLIGVIVLLRLKVRR